MYNIVSLFCGTGGLDLGFVGDFEFLGKTYEKLPFKINLAVDNDADAVGNYNENSKFFLDHKAELMDVRDIDYKNVENFDVLLAGFPCQPFSNAGNRKGVLDERGTLFEEVIRAVLTKKPKIIIMENVRGITSSKMPDGRKVIEEIEERLKFSEFKDIEYVMLKPRLIKASDFGVPQDRYRVIMIAIRNDIYDENICLNSLEKYCKNFSKDELTVKNIINPSSEIPNSNDIWQLSPQAMNMVPYIKRSWKDIPYEFLPERLKKIKDDMKKYRSPNFYRRFSLEEINGTITASAQPEKCGILHPLENRRYSVREIARIQSFPDNFTFNYPNISGKYKVIGNAVPPVLAHSIAKFIKNILDKKISK